MFNRDKAGGEGHGHVTDTERVARTVTAKPAKAKSASWLGGANTSSRPAAVGVSARAVDEEVAVTVVAAPVCAPSPTRVEQKSRGANGRRLAVSSRVYLPACSMAALAAALVGIGWSSRFGGTGFAAYMSSVRVIVIGPISLADYRGVSRCGAGAASTTATAVRPWSPSGPPLYGLHRDARHSTRRGAYPLVF